MLIIVQEPGKNPNKGPWLYQILGRKFGKKLMFRFLPIEWFRSTNLQLTFPNSRPGLKEALEINQGREIGITPG